MKATMEKTRKLLKKALKIVIYLHLGLFAVVFVFIAVCTFINPPVNSLMIHRFLVFDHPLRPVNYVPLRQIPKPLRSMLVTLEDANYYTHFGIDPEAMLEAFYLNLKTKRRSLGASTIDQQLARTLFLYPKKSFLRKYLEILIAMEMDLFMEKDRILELYFNSVEWGRGVFGIQNASRHYYGKSVSDLDRDEMMRLVAILPSPVKYGPTNFGNLRSLNIRYQLLRYLDDTNNFLGGTNSLTNGSTNLVDFSILNAVIDTNLGTSSYEDAPESSDEAADDNR